MDLTQKLTILGGAAKFDVSCASSGSTRRPGGKGSVGSAFSAGICHSWSADGRCVSLLKVLLSNDCVYDCAYCPNRRSSDAPRASFEPRELASLVVEFYRRNYIEGLFLSSGVVGTPDRTMELFIRTLEILRGELKFCGYVHVKLIPGASGPLIEKVGLLADRLSVNIELPSRASLRLLAPQKAPDGILSPMEHVKLMRLRNEADRARYRAAPLFAPSGQTTQMIVGATPDTDLAILRLSEGLYKRYNMKRVYFSAFVPVAAHPNLPAVRAPLLREHRLYQADWLMRFYMFSPNELLSEDMPGLDMELDPKCAWALRHPEFFPVDVNAADYGALLRVPGVGVVSAKRIMAARRSKRLELSDLKKLGAVMKRAKYFVSAKGAFSAPFEPSNPLLRGVLADGGQMEQLSLFGGERPALQGHVTEPDFFDGLPAGAGALPAGAGTGRLPPAGAGFLP